MNNIILCSALSDPNGVFLEDIEKAAPLILETYKKWVVNATEGTDERVKESLRAKGAVVVKAKRRLAKDKIEADHLSALFHAERVARKEGVVKIQYMDGDRVLMAATYFPEAFKKMAQTVEGSLREEGSYLNGRRSPEDMFTHHSPLVETELEFNRLYSKILGVPYLDVGSTIHGFSREVVREILKRSPEMETVTFPHPKWMIIAEKTGVGIQSIEISQVGSFETPQQFKKEVAERLELIPSELTEYEGLRLAYMATLGKESTVSPAEWKRRFELYRQYIKILETELPHLGMSEEKEEEARRMIKESRNFMTRKETIVGLGPEKRSRRVKGVREIREESLKRWGPGLEEKG